MRQEFETFQAELEAKLEAKFEADFEAKFEAKFETLNAKFATNAALVERTVDVVEINEVAFRTASGANASASFPQKRGLTTDVLRRHL